MNQLSKTLNRYFQKGVIPHTFAFTLLNPLRKFKLSPDQLIKRLNLKNHHQVLEIGPGPGYFSKKVAKEISNGKLILFDVQKEMLEKAKKRLDKAGIKNVEYIKGDAKELPFSEKEFDRIFLVAVLGETEDAYKVIKNASKVMKKQGILSISEQPGDPDFLEFDLVKSLGEKAGLYIYNVYGNKKNYTINFKK